MKNNLRFLYASGSPVGFILNETTPYFYVKNLMGDICEIVEKDGNTVASYYYDAWGSLIKSEGEEDVLAINPLRIGKEPSKDITAFNEVNRLCWSMHDVLWISWRGIGEYMGGDKLDWARGLKNKTIRRMIADCFAFVRDSDDCILGN